MKMISKIVVKVVLLSLIIVCASSLSMATVYYISSTGNDANSGLTTALPWKTITKVNAATFKAGDQILFKRGDTFRGTITMKQSGISGNPIKYGAYGTGVNPNITGFTTVTAWTNLGSNIWESTSAVSTLSDCNMVSIGGENTPMGRTPNAGSYYTAQSHSSNTSVTSSNLTGTPNWTGAQIVNRLIYWIWGVGTITSQSGSTVTYNDGSTTQVTDGNGFFIQADARTLDVQNEWYYNPSTKKIRVYSTLQPTNVNVAAYVNGFGGYNKDYITIQDLTIKGFNEYGINSNTLDYLTVQNCIIDKIGFVGIQVYASSNYTFNSNIIKNCNYSAIMANGSGGNNNETITNNTIDSTNMIIGINQKYAPGAIITNADQSLIQYNTIDYSGYNGITTYSANGQIRNNFINNSMQNRSDGGGIYTSGAHTNLILDGNIVANTKGYGLANKNVYDGVAGIYLDLGSQYVTVSNNTVINSICPISNNGRGIYTSGSDHITITGNTTFDNNCGLKISNMFSAAGTCNNMIVNNNKFVAKKTTQRAATFESKFDEIPTFFISATGNIYARPIDDNLSIYYHQPNSNWLFKSLTQWQTFSGVDANSKKSPQAITSENEFRFEYNATKTAKSVTLTQPMIDMKGTKYGTSVILQPFTSVVLMKDANPGKYSTEYKSICDGLSYKGWTSTGKYESTLIAKSGVDSIVTTYLTVNPKYAVQEDVTIYSGETYQGWNTSGTHTRTLNSVSGCDSVVTTHLTVSTIKVVTTQTIQLKKGSNMISTYLQATNPDVSLVTKTIRDSGNLIKMQNESGSSYENWGTLGGWTNNLGSMQNTEGYKIMVANDCVLQVTGTQINLSLNIPLNIGWNIISFPRADILDAKMIIQSLIDQSSLVKVQDEIGNSIEDWGVFGGWKNGIGNFLPGKAYRVKVSKSAVLTIQDIYPKSVAIPVYTEQTEHFSSIAEGNGSDHMNINLVGLNESGLSAGDELAAFDGNLCVGTLKITDQHLMNGSASLIASCSTGNLNKDGFNEGSSIQIQVWNQISGEESAVQVSILHGSNTYQKNATILGKLKSLTTSVSNFAEETKIEVYPNPSQGRFTVQFSELPESGSRIDVLDLSGRKITSRLITGTSEEFDLFGQAAGIYLVKSILGVKENIDKIIIQY